MGGGRKFHSICTCLFTVVFDERRNIRNKLTIEGKLIGNPADALFQMSIHMQHWRVLVKPKDHALLDAATDEARRLYARTRT
jgi:hypothetical protein